MAIPVVAVGAPEIIRAVVVGAPEKTLAAAVVAPEKPRKRKEKRTPLEKLKP